MPTKVQSKAAIDAAVVLAKNDIDNILPVGVNIIDGSINFGPVKLTFIIDAGGVLATAQLWLDTISTNLGTFSRTFKVTGSRGRRGGDLQMTGTKIIIITSDLSTYNIINIG